MGTRNLTAVILGGKHVVAQYGQWDGYPEGNGVKVLNFIRENDMNGFAEKCKKLHFATDEELDGKTLDDYPHMSRDHGAGILELIMKNDIDILQDSMSFGADSLFCEWAYVLDLDNRKLECYEGFNRNKVPDTNRFSVFKKDDESGYEHVELKHVFDFDNLPTDEDFVRLISPDDDDDGSDDNE